MPIPKCKCVIKHKEEICLVFEKKKKRQDKKSLATPVSWAPLASAGSKKADNQWELSGMNYQQFSPVRPQSCQFCPSGGHQE